MRAFRNYLLALLAMTAAFLAISVTAQFAAAPAAQAHVRLADPACPAGTNWDNTLMECR